MLKDIFGSLGFVIVGSDILFWAYFFIMDKVSVFESSDFGELRIIVDPKGDVWFVASDVAKSLGYINAKDAVKRHVDDDDSILLQVSDNQWGVNQSILKTRYIDSIRIINESGLYSLILSSKLESAKRFKRWITSEVLPSIRKTGEYKTSSGGKGILVPDFSNPADAARAWADQYEAAQKAIAEKSQAEAEKQQALKTIEEHKPDVEFAESFRKVDHNNMWLIRDIAKKLEQNGVIIAEKNLRSFLEEAKFMFRNGLGKWKLYEELRSRYDRVSMTFGYITKHNRIKYGIEKSHTSDAFVISKNINAKRIERQYLKRLIRRHNRQIHKMKILKGGNKKNNQAPFEVFGFRLFDKVLYNNKIFFVYGRRKSGSFNIRDFNGENSKDVSHKKFKLIRGKRHPIILK